jgi:hypothetical protein
MFPSLQLKTKRDPVFVFSSYLEFRTIDKAQKTSDSEGQKMYTGTQNAFFLIVCPFSDIILIVELSYRSLSKIIVRKDITLGKSKYVLLGAEKPILKG